MQELVITAGGENIAPVPIEDAIKAELSEIVSHVMLVGDNRKYLSVLMTLKTETTDINSSASDRLHPDVIAWLQKRNCPVKTLTGVSKSLSSEFEADIMNAIDAANENAQSRAHKVQKFVIVPQEFAVESGELTPTLKIKRHVVLAKYKKEIDNLYK